MRDTTIIMIPPRASYIADAETQTSPIPLYHILFLCNYCYSLYLPLVRLYIPKGQRTVSVYLEYVYAYLKKLTL